MSNVVARITLQLMGWHWGSCGFTWHSVGGVPGGPDITETINSPAATNPATAETARPFCPAAFTKAAMPSRTTVATTRRAWYAIAYVAMKSAMEGRGADRGICKLR